MSSTVSSIVSQHYGQHRGSTVSQHCEQLQMASTGRWQADATEEGVEMPGARGQCCCRKMVGGTMEHIGQVEAMMDVMQRNGKSRKELKCRYPEELVRKMLCWLDPCI